jgi:nucleoside-diphosphate-sugar epimerase
MSIYITGASGFVGKNLVEYFKYSKTIVKATRNSPIEIEEQVVIHLAGKAHDLKNVSTPDEYYKVNTELTNEIFDAFLASKAKLFITLSSVKAVADGIEGELSEDVIPNPTTHYGKSKLLAEQYILSQSIPEGKRVYILRPCMIHGPGNKGNLNLLYSLVSKGLPWPLGLFENSRSYLSIENLCFIIKELIDREDIPSGIYNIADDVSLSTNEVIRLIGELKGGKAKILRLNKSFVSFLAQLGTLMKFPFNSERLSKLTESYMVSNDKIRKALGKSLPVSSKEGLIRTFESFANKKSSN